MPEEPKLDSSNADDVEDVEVEDDEVFNDNVEGAEQLNGDQSMKDTDEEPSMKVPELPEFTKKDKTLHEVLSMMEDYYPIVRIDLLMPRAALVCPDR